MTAPKPPAERFWPKVDFHGPLPVHRPELGVCWLWTAGTKRGTCQLRGYFFDGRRHVYAHRAAYELTVGPIPEGLEIDHLCRLPLCVRPSHLEAVTHAENIRRGLSATATHCQRGHAFDDENTYVTPEGRRRCKTCVRERDRNRDRIRTRRSVSR